MYCLCHKYREYNDICYKKMSNPIELRRHKVFFHKETEGAWLCEKCTFEKHIADKH